MGVTENVTTDTMEDDMREISIEEITDTTDGQKINFCKKSINYCTEFVMNFMLISI